MHLDLEQYTGSCVCVCVCVGGGGVEGQEIMNLCFQHFMTSKYA